MITFNTDVNIYIDDIIDELDMFSKSDLNKLKDELDLLVDDEKKYTFEVRTLEDEYKFKILEEMYNKYTLEELDKLNKK